MRPAVQHVHARQRQRRARSHRRRSGRAEGRTRRRRPSRPRARPRAARSHRGATCCRCRRARSAPGRAARWSRPSRPTIVSAISPLTFADRAAGRSCRRSGRRRRAARPPRARRCSAPLGHRGPAAGPESELDLDLDGRIAARVQDLARQDVDNDAHGPPSLGAAVVGVSNVAACTPTIRAIRPGLFAVRGLHHRSGVASIRTVPSNRSSRRVRRPRSTARRPGRSAPPPGRLPGVRRELLHAHETFAEARRPAPQRGLGVDPARAGEHHRGREQIAERGLGRRRVRVAERVERDRRTVQRLGVRARLEPDRRGLAVQLVCVEQ